MILHCKKSSLPHYFLPIFLVIHVLSACAIPPTEPPKDLIGTLRISGPNVFLNGSGAENGMSVYNGDNVTTGSGSSAIVVLPNGGSVQLDENTDPIFTWERFQTGICLIVKIFRGQAWVDESEYCVGLINSNTDLLINSKVNIKIAPSRSVITVLEGNVTIERPRKLRIQASEQVTISERGIEGVRKLTRQELRSVISWRGIYEFQGWCCTDGEVFKSRPDDCKRRRGYFGYNEIEVRRRCQPRTGWCCSGGRVFESDPDNCKREEGYFSYDQKETYDRCQPRTGWCCIPSTSEGVKGQVFQTAPNECRLKKGYFSYDRGAADERCLPRIY
jgi:hypothetical protein